MQQALGALAFGTIIFIAVVAYGREGKGDRRFAERLVAGRGVWRVK